MTALLSRLHPNVITVTAKSKKKKLEKKVRIIIKHLEVRRLAALPHPPPLSGFAQTLLLMWLVDPFCLQTLSQCDLSMLGDPDGPHPDQLSPGYVGRIGRRGIIELHSHLAMCSKFRINYFFLVVRFFVEVGSIWIFWFSWSFVSPEPLPFPSS